MMYILVLSSFTLFGKEYSPKNRLIPGCTGSKCVDISYVNYLRVIPIEQIFHNKLL